LDVRESVPYVQEPDSQTDVFTATSEATVHLPLPSLARSSWWAVDSFHPQRRRLPRLGHVHYRAAVALADRAAGAWLQGPPSSLRQGVQNEIGSFVSGGTLAEAVIAVGDNVVATARHPEALRHLVDQAPDRVLALTL
jgi:hypothetical protein